MSYLIRVEGLTRLQQCPAKTLSGAKRVATDAYRHWRGMVSVYSVDGQDCVRLSDRIDGKWVDTTDDAVVQLRSVQRATHNE